MGEEFHDWLRSRSEEAVLIDSGGILFNNVIENSTFIADAADVFNVDSDALRSRYVASDSIFERAEQGVHEVLIKCVYELAGRWPSDCSLSQVDQLYIARTIADECIFAALRSVRSAGQKLVLANNEAEHWDKLKNDAYGHLGLFDVIGSSWHLAAQKPEPAYFARLDEVLWPIGRKDWHLIDDNPLIVAAAQAEGIRATFYGRPMFHSRVERSE